MSNLFQDAAKSAADDDLLGSLSDDVVALIVSFMDPVEASALSKRFLKDVEQRAEDALQLNNEKMSQIMYGDHMSHLTKAAWEHCKIPRDSRPDRLQLPWRLLLIVARRIFVCVVTGAGTPEVNGVYTQYPYMRGACTYTREGMWKGGKYTFHIYQCLVSDYSKHWFISINPYGGIPGSSSDIDFYSSPVTSDCLVIPPVSSWVTAPGEGREPMPTLSCMHPYTEQDHRQRLEDAIAAHPGDD